MLTTLLKAKLHRVTVTQACVDYEGSCAIDAALLDLAGIREFEQIHLYNVSNGERLITYAIKASEHSGIISVNGAAAHKAAPGDLLIVASYAQYAPEELGAYAPRLLYIDCHNHVIRICDALDVAASDLAS